jgi:hypothetical protein
MMIHVVDALTPRQSLLKASLWGALLSLANDHETDPSSDLSVGECRRWMAEAVLLPTVLASGEILQWRGHGVDDDDDGDDNNNNKAMLVTVSSTTGGGEDVVVFSFDPTTHMPTSVEALRPKASSGDAKSFVRAPWKGLLSNFQAVETSFGPIVVPTHMEGGWLESSNDDNADHPNLELYFVADLHDFMFD